VLDRLRNWRRKRANRRAYREMVQRYYADGGDVRFRFDYALEPDSVVLDLGGYEGDWAGDLHGRQRCRIHVFEPVQRFASAIRERFRDNPDIEVHALALGNGERTETIHIRGASSSLYKGRAEAEEIRFIDVADWFAASGIDEVALMKINIEGGEYELLERMIEAGLIPRVRDIQVQFHNFAPDAPERMAAIQQALALTHEPTYQYRFVWENWRRR
jgi:FkbM family methyltransferase